MKYDFDTVIDRRNNGSAKWDVKENELPLSTADMDFRVAPEIIEDLHKVIDHGVYGYHDVTEDWYKAYQSFFLDLHNWKIEKESLFFSTGVVPTLSSSVRALTKIGEGVIILPPVYNIFYNSIRNNFRKIIEVPLLYNEGFYSIDFVGIEEAMKDTNNTMLIFCNPGNPVGRIWTEEEISKLIELGIKYNVRILSDEIHCDITKPGLKYVPFLTVNKAKEIGFAAISPTKCFNLAGTQGSAIVIDNEEIRRLVIRQLNTDECAEPNLIACQAAVSAFNKGRDYLVQCNEYLFKNREHVENFIQANCPKLKVIKGVATYLVWIDISEYGIPSDKFCDDLRKRTGLILNSGAHYGKTGDGFVRLSVSCPRKTLDDGLARLKSFIDSL